MGIELFLFVFSTAMVIERKKGRNRVTEKSSLVWRVYILVPTVSQKESRVLVSGNWERIHFIYFFTFVFERLPSEKEKLLADRISRICKYKSLSFWDRFNLLGFDPILPDSPPAEKSEKKKKTKEDPR